MSSPTPRAGAPAPRVPQTGPATIVVGLFIAFCVLLLKWLAVVALAALVLAGLVWWARRGSTRPRPVEPAPTVTIGPAPVAPRAPADDDCSWCGLPGGHRGVGGRLVRPRHVHQGR